MTYLKIIALFVLAVLVQSLLPMLIPAYHWLHIEWSLILVVLVGFKFRWPVALRLGLVAGLLLDLFSGGRLGVFALSYLTIALGISLLRNILQQEHILWESVAVLCATLLVWTVNYLILNLFYTYPGYFGSMLWIRILPQALMNALCVWPVHAVFPHRPSRRRGYLF